ncbi:MAG: hypothetical protein CL930_01670 [Deltaproteobacteria bacterium]|jgi:hypothetical protein|nr:hypothetical protein [Deltaproteobacteria bacterium]
MEKAEMIRNWMCTLALLTVACGGESPDKSAATGAETAAKPAVEKKVVKFDKSTLQAEALEIALVPSPAEMQKALNNAGLQSQLSTMVEKRDIAMKAENKDQIAVRTGVVLADLVLTVQDATTEEQLARLNRLKEGFALLGAGDDVANTIEDLRGQIQGGSGSRADLLKEFDELSGVLVPELKYEAGEWVVPLIQAGSWLEGAHLVSGAIKKEAKYEEAGKLLKQPAVVDYFLKYVQREGSDKAPDQVVKKLEETLTMLKEITSKETIEEEDVNNIYSATGAVLTML